MSQTKTFSALSALAVGVILTCSALALVPHPDEVRTVAEMPLAVTEVVELGVPERQVETVVVRLNEARVPARDSVEIVRYSAFPLVVDTYRPPERVTLDLSPSLGQVDLDALDMVYLVGSHFDDGLRGESLAGAVLQDLARLGFLAAADDWRVAPRPVDRDFVYYVEPGYRFDSGIGLFDGREVIIDRDFIVRRDTWYRDRDYVYDDYYDDSDWDDSDYSDRDYGGDRGGPPAVPPGHAKHDRPDGPPGHVKHDGPDGPPGHAKHDDGRRSWRRPAGRDAGPPARGAKDKGGPGRGNAAAGNPGRGNSGQGKAKGNPGRGNGKGNGNGKGRGGR